MLEKLMASRLTKFVNSLLFNLNDYQFGFRQHHPTSLALIDVIDNIYSHLDNKECVLGRGVVHSWFSSYLENRTQFISVNGYDSNRLPVTCAVPQG